MSSDTAKVAEKIVSERFSCRKFLDKPLPKGLLERILGYSLRAPSSLNMAPYRLVVVKDKKMLEKLHDCYRDFNLEATKNIQAAVIFCADQKPSQNFEAGKKLWREGGKTEEQIERFFKYCEIRFPDSSADEPCKCGKYINPAISWANQNIGYIADHFMLLCTANGLATLPMGGYDPAQVCEVIKIPKTYIPELIVAVGYPAEGAHHYISKRYPPEHLIYEDKFGKEYKDIPIPDIKL